MKTLKVIDSVLVLLSDPLGGVIATFLIMRLVDLWSLAEVAIQVWIYNIMDILE